MWIHYSSAFHSLCGFWKSEGGRSDMGAGMHGIIEALFWDFPCFARRGLSTESHNVRGILAEDAYQTCPKS